jgi:hypothetical protein
MADTMLLTPQQRAILDRQFPEDVTAIDTVAKDGQGWLMSFRDGVALLMPVIDGRAGFVCVYDAPSLEVAETAARVIARGFYETATTAVGDQVIAEARSAVDPAAVGDQVSAEARSAMDPAAIGDQVSAEARSAIDPAAMLEMLRQLAPA